MKKLILATFLLTTTTSAFAGGRWVDEPDIPRPELVERYSYLPVVITDPRYCTQYMVYTSYNTGATMVLRVDQNGEPAKARRCTPTDPAPEKKKQQ